MLAPAFPPESSARPAAEGDPSRLIDSFAPVLDAAFGLDRSGVFPEEIEALLARLGGPARTPWDEAAEEVEEAAADPVLAPA